MQKVAEEQSTATSLPAARRSPRCQDEPSKSKSRPDRSTATQKVVVGHDTELRAPVGSMCRPLVHVAPSKRNALPEKSTATQNVAVAQDTANGPPFDASNS